MLIGLVVLLLVLAAIPIVLLASNSQHSGGTRSAGAGTTAAPSPTPVSPQVYQQALDAFSAAVKDQFAALAAQHTPDTVHNIAGNAQDALSRGLTTLQNLNPPAAVATAHQQLLGALQGLNTSLLGVVSGSVEDPTDPNADGIKLCTGSAAISNITTGPAYDDVHAAMKTLAAADPAHPYTLADFLPAVVPQANRQLGNGAVIKKSANGANTVKVEDKYDTDAVLSLEPVNTTSSAVMVYVRAGATATTTAIKDGTYNVFVTRGQDWDPDTKAFTRGCSFEQFDDTIQLTSNSRQYTVETITLNSGGSGNAGGARGSPDSFPV